MSNDETIKATEFLNRAMQLNDKQYKKLCKKIQQDFENASTDDYTAILHIICSLDALRSKKGA